MQAEDRPIHFSAEIIHGPARHEVAALQRLYYDLSQSRAGGYQSSDFTSKPPKFYSKRGAQSQSTLVFLPDRFLIIEEWVDVPFASFVERVEEVVPRVMDALSVTELPAHTSTVRTTFGLTHFEDARVFLMDHACQLSGRIGDFFMRPIGVGGLKFVLPETPEHPGNLQVAIESYRQGPQEVFVEVKGIYAGKKLAREQLADISDNIRSIRAFINERIYPFLNQFDSPGAGLP
jgi:hypothetical protein